MVRPVMLKNNERSLSRQPRISSFCNTDIFEKNFNFRNIHHGIFWHLHVYGAL